MASFLVPRIKALGANLAYSNSSTIAAEELEPMGSGITINFLAMVSPFCGCFAKIIFDVVGSMPPQKLMGASSRRTVPLASPGKST